MIRAARAKQGESYIARACCSAAAGGIKYCVPGIPTQQEAIEAAGKSKVLTMSAGFTYGRFGTIEGGFYTTDTTTGYFLTVGGTTPAAAKKNAFEALADFERMGPKALVKPTAANGQIGVYNTLELMSGYGATVTGGTSMPFSPTYSHSWSVNPETWKFTSSGHSAGVGTRPGMLTGQFTYTVFFDNQRK